MSWLSARAPGATRSRLTRRHWAEHVLLPAEMAGRELARRRTALGLLTLLPLAFYAASRSNSSYAPVLGGIAMAFSISGAAIFCVMASRRLDSRLVLSGYRPRELMIGRLLLLESLGALVALLFTGVIVLGSSPSDPSELLCGVFLVTLTAVPFGLAVGALVPSELESVLILIGVVGIQLTLSVSNPIAKFLPFWGAQRLLNQSASGVGGTTWPIIVAFLYAAGLFVVACWAVNRRYVNVR
jgi:hypothetical protein